ncbi:MAG: FRG domain-containing protein [Candidatus Reddybacter sp.]
MSIDDKYDFSKITSIVYRGNISVNDIEIVQCSSWRDFQEKVKFTEKPFGNRVFRGQRDPEWKLNSKWDRYQEQKDSIRDGETAIRGRNETPDSFLQAFKDGYIGNANSDTSSLNSEQWMALGRHHGLVTPLLDWTKSPYVAAYFAYNEYLPIDKELGCLNPVPLEPRDGYIAVWEIPLNSILKSFTELKVVHSRYEAANRQKAQSGLFTLLDSSLKIPLDDFLKEKNYQHILKKYLVPKREVIIAMHDLHLMNINENTMFPDADGAARQANLGNYLDWASLLDQNK